VHEADVRCFIYLQSSCKRLWAPARIVDAPQKNPSFFYSHSHSLEGPSWRQAQSRLQPAPCRRLSCFAQASAELRETCVWWKCRCVCKVTANPLPSLFLASAVALATSSLPVVLCKLAQGHDHSGLVSRAAKLQGLLLPCLAKKWRLKYPLAVNVVFCSSRCVRVMWFSVANLKIRRI
jgi:hypothetical protein